MKCVVGGGGEYRASSATRVFGDGGEGSLNLNWSATGRWMESLVGEENHPALPNEGNDECISGRTSIKISSCQDFIPGERQEMAGAAPPSSACAVFASIAFDHTKCTSVSMVGG